MIDAEIPDAPDRQTLRLSSKIISIDNDNFTYKGSKDTSTETDERLQRLREGARAEGEAKKRFWNMLVANVARSGYIPPKDRPTEIIELACGRCDEAGALDEFFGGGEFGTSTNRVNLTGIDINQSDIDKAIKNNQRPDFSKPIITYQLPQNYRFLVGDATNLDQCPQVPPEADVVMIRHQQISDNEQVWKNIFQQALQRVRPHDGIVLITSFSDIEHQMMLTALKQLDCNVALNEKNPYAKSTTTPEVSIDRNIAIVKRGKGQSIS